MKSEMDVLSMDERQRLCWLRANRVTLMIVGLVWLGLIGWELASGRSPWFFIAMVPVFAVIRLAAYKYLARQN